MENLQPEGIIATIGTDFISKYYYIKYGDRPLPSKIHSMTSPELAELIVGVFSKRWTKLYDVAEEIAYFTGFDSETIIDENNLDNYTKSVLSENVDKVTAFDSPTLTTDNANDNSITESNEQDKTRRFTKKERDIQNVDIRRNMIDNSNIIDIVCDDVLSVIALKIY